MVKAWSRRLDWSETITKLLSWGQLKYYLLIAREKDPSHIREGLILVTKNYLFFIWSQPLIYLSILSRLTPVQTLRAVCVGSSDERWHPFYCQYFPYMSRISLSNRELLRFDLSLTPPFFCTWTCNLIENLFCFVYRHFGSNEDCYTQY